MTFKFVPESPIKSYATAYNTLAFEAKKQSKTAEYIDKDTYYAVTYFVDTSHEWFKLIDGDDLHSDVELRGKPLFDMLRKVEKELYSIAEQFEFEISLASREHLANGEYTLYVLDIMEDDVKQINKLYEHIAR